MSTKGGLRSCKLQRRVGVGLVNVLCKARFSHLEIVGMDGSTRSNNRTADEFVLVSEQGMYKRVVAAVQK
jgi:hypothetical protein